MAIIFPVRNVENFLPSPFPSYPASLASGALCPGQSHTLVTPHTLVIPHSVVTPHALVRPHTLVTPYAMVPPHALVTPPVLVTPWGHGA